MMPNTGPTVADQPHLVAYLVLSEQGPTTNISAETISRPMVPLGPLSLDIHLPHAVSNSPLTALCLPPSTQPPAPLATSPVVKVRRH